MCDLEEEEEEDHHDKFKKLSFFSEEQLHLNVNIVSDYSLKGTKDQLNVLRPES